MFAVILVFKLHSTLHHTDVDECERDADNCDVNANCSDTEGSFNCTCVTGYEGDGMNCISKSKP